MSRTLLFVSIFSFGFLVLIIVGVALRIFVIAPLKLNQNKKNPSSQASTHSLQNRSISYAIPSAGTGASVTPSPAFYSWVAVGPQDQGQYYEYYEAHGKVYANSVPPSVISGADPSTFMVASGTGVQNFAKDKTHVYWYGGIVYGADPKTFTLPFSPSGEWQGYGKDQNHVFFFDGIGSPYIVPGADAKTFVSLGKFESCPDGQDKNRQYCGGAPIK